jgi:hypothetical protein
MWRTRLDWRENMCVRLPMRLLERLVLSVPPWYWLNSDYYRCSNYYRSCPNHYCNEPFSDRLEVAWCR